MHTQNQSIERNYETRNYGPLRQIKQRFGLVTRLLVEEFRTETLSAVTTRKIGRLRLKYDGTCAETKFRLSRGTGESIYIGPWGGVSSVDCWQPEVCASAVVMLDTPCSEVV